MFKSKRTIIDNYFFIFIPNKKVLAPLKIDLDLTLDDLKEIERQKEIVFKNTMNFVNELPSDYVSWVQKY